MSAPPVGTPLRGEGAAPWRAGRFLRVVLAGPLLALYRVRFLGAENLPAGCGYILAGNHVSYLDPILLWVGVPQETHFIAKQELFDTPIVGWGLRRLWVLPITRASADREGIQRAASLLKRGECVGIFPEGTRQRPGQAADDPRQAHAGVAFIAIHAGAPVVPVGIAGTERALPRGAWLPRFPRVTVRFGEPVRPEDFSGMGRKERLEAMTAEIMRRIAEARDQAEGE